MRRGLTLIETLIVLTIAGTLMAMAIPHVVLSLDRISVHAAATDLAQTLHSARSLALASRTSIAVDFGGPDGALRVRHADGIVFTRNIASAHGVQLGHSRDSLAFGPYGLGAGAANLSIVVSRRATAETVFVSRLGRVR